MIIKWDTGTLQMFIIFIIVSIIIINEIPALQMVLIIIIIINVCCDIQLLKFSTASWYKMANYVNQNIGSFYFCKY